MLVVLGGLNVALIVAILVGHREIRLARASYGAPEVPARFIGVDIEGRPVTVAVSAPGTVVWFGTDQCPYCKADGEIPRLLAALQKKGWQTIVLLPSYDRRFEPAVLGFPDVQMVPFVGGEWLRQFPLVVTPTLLIFDREQRLAWYRRGTLTSSDTAQALRVAGVSSLDRAMESSDDGDARRASN
jgi:hypothetical protein